MPRPPFRRGLIVPFDGDTDFFVDPNPGGIWIGDDRFRRLTPLPVPPGWQEGPSGWHLIVYVRVGEMRCSRFGGISGKVEIVDDKDVLAPIQAEDWRGVSVCLKHNATPRAATAEAESGRDWWYFPFAREVPGGWTPAIRRIRLRGPIPNHDRHVIIGPRRSGGRP